MDLNTGDKAVAINVSDDVTINIGDNTVTVNAVMTT